MPQRTRRTPADRPVGPASWPASGTVSPPAATTPSPAPALDRPAADGGGLERHALIRALAIVAAALAALAGTVLVSIRAVGAQGDDDVKLESVRFDLGRSATAAEGPLTPANGDAPVRYRSIVVTDDATEVQLEPMVGPVRITLDQDDLASVAVQSGDAMVTADTDGFVDLLADAAASAKVDRLVRFSPAPDSGPVAVNVSYARPLTGDDYLLVQEHGGDSALDLAALDGDGNVIGQQVLVGPSFQLNTGYATPADPSWASVVPVARFGLGAGPVAAVRVTGFAAEFKVVALGKRTADQEAAPVAAVPTEQPTAPPSEQETATPPQATLAGAGAEPEPEAGPEEALYAAVGLESTIQPAIAVNGAGCEARPETGREIATGQSVTYCFTVTNLGTASLTDIEISDGQLGLVDASLPKATGPDVLGPGEQAVFYYHSVTGARSGEAVSTVTASPADAAGAPIAGLVAPSGSSAPGAIGEPGAPPTGVEAAGSGALTAPPTSDQPPAELPQDGPPATLAKTADGTQAPTPQAPAEAADLGAVTQLAHTGIPTEPWILVILAMGLIFFGYTIFVAFQNVRRSDELCGHEQLDALGFD